MKAEKTKVTGAMVLIVDDMEMNRNVLHDFIINTEHEPDLAGIEAGQRHIEILCFQI